MPPATRLVDVHTHLYPEWYLDVLAERDRVPKVVDDGGGGRSFVIFAEEDEPGGVGRPMDDTYWSEQRKVEFMDAAGITESWVSLGNPWLDPLAGSNSQDLARRANEWFATMPDRTQNRCRGFGVLPSDAVGAACEIVTEMADLPLAGVTIGTTVCGLPLDDPELAPLWLLLEESRLPVLLHPSPGLGMDVLKGFGHALAVGMAFPFETSAALARLMFSGVLTRHRDLVLIGSHGAGTIPFLVHRLDAAWRSDPSLHERAPEPPSVVASRLYADTITYGAAPLRAALDLFSAERLLFGTDHPFSIADPAANLEAIDSVVTGTDRTSVRSGNADALAMAGSDA